MRRFLAAVIMLSICGCGGASHPSSAASPGATDKTLSAGLAAQKSGDTGTATRLYNEVLAKQPSNLYAHYNLGVIAQQAGHQAAALKEYAAALATNPSYVPALFNEATLYATTDPIQAITLYRQILRIQPISPTAQLNLGLIEARQGQTKLANHDLSVAVREDPSLADQGSDPNCDLIAGSRSVMPRVTVFTPSHDPTYLGDCYADLAAQTFSDWEWVVLLNGKATSWSPPVEDERVRVERAPGRVRGVGVAKRLACEHAQGELLVELDHDDRIIADCLAKVVETFDKHHDAVLVFSDFTQINSDGSPNSDRFDESAGWQYSSVDIDGTTYLSCAALEASPHNVSHIWYAPNHVRAFRQSAYIEVGGYDSDLVVLDDQDLMMRLFAAGEFVRIPECLYLQRVHRRNTQRDPKLNAEIQQQTLEMYLAHIEAMSLGWASRRGLAAVHLTTPTSVKVAPFDERFTPVTIDPAAPRLPFVPDQVGVIQAIDVLSRMPDRGAFINECHRVLAHAGVLLTDTPSTDGRGAYQDPSNIAFYNENSFAYLTQAELRPAVPGLEARFQASHVRTYYPTQAHEELDIPYVKANLLAIKDGPRQGGLLLC